MASGQNQLKLWPDALQRSGSNIKKSSIAGHCPAPGGNWCRPAQEAMDCFSGFAQGSRAGAQSLRVGIGSRELCCRLSWYCKDLPEKDSKAQDCPQA